MKQMVVCKTGVGFDENKKGRCQGSEKANM